MIETYETDLSPAPKSSLPRFEPRARIPAKSKLHSKRPPIRGSPGVRLDLRIRFLDEEPEGAEREAERKLASARAVSLQSSCRRSWPPERGVILFPFSSQRT